MRKDVAALSWSFATHFLALARSRLAVCWSCTKSVQAYEFGSPKRRAQRRVLTGPSRRKLDFPSAGTTIALRAGCLVCTRSAFPKEDSYATSYV